MLKEHAPEVGTVLRHQPVPSDAIMDVHYVAIVGDAGSPHG
jgi:hypothetical protein